MGTPAAIGIVSPDGTVRACYIHYDGYLLDGVGEELLRHHDRYALAARLVASGDRSSLDPVGMGKVHQYQSVAAYLSLAPGKQVCDYGYLFERGCWSAWAVELTGPQPDLPAPLRFKLSERLPLRTALVLVGDL